MKTFKNNLEIAEYLIKLAKRAYKKCSKIAIEVKDKGSHDLLTTLDTSLEKYVLNDFKTSFPNVKVVSEEFNTNIKAEGTYLTIDPVDGTINFANGIEELWAVQFAYVENDITIASAIYSPKLGAYHAAKGFGAFKNGKRFYVKRNDPLHSLVSLEIQNTDYYCKLMKELNDKILKFRHIGAASIHSIWMAEGKIGSWAVADINPWDLLPGFLLTDEAGCYRTDVASLHIVASTKDTLNVMKASAEKTMTEKQKQEKVKVKASDCNNK